MFSYKPSHNKRSAIVFTIGLSFIISACGEDSSSSSGTGYSTAIENQTNFNENALITNLADNVIAPTFSEFQQLAANQVTAVNNYCQAEQNLANNLTDLSSVSDAKTAAQNSWQQAMSTWQQAEIMQIGPLLDNESTLRNNIYSWPIVNHCAIDYDVMFFKNDQVDGAPYDITLRLPSRKSMVALEYLLFNQSLNSSCPTESPTGWDNLTDTEKTIIRCQFATEVATDIANNANTIVNEWTVYANELKQAGTNSTVFSNEHEAVNQLSDALFYIDSTTKDVKLAEPLGIFANACGSQICPKAVESPYSMTSISHITNNLIGLQRLLTGVTSNNEDGLGFLDYLIDAGDAQAAETMQTNLTSAINLSQSYDSSLAATLTADPEKATATHTEIKKVTDQLKTDFIKSLALELPQTSAGDND